MKKFTTILTAAFLSFVVSGFSQKAAKITGEVKDDMQKPFAGATVSLYRAKDTSLVKAAFSDKTGQYAFEAVPDGTYLVGVSSAGFKRSVSSLITVASGTDAGVAAFVMQPEAKGLKEITVQGKKPLFEQKADRMVVNVEASPTNAGANALEVLEKSPGITVDKDGNISLKGKAGVQVFIDGKPAYLSGQDLVNYLRNLSGAQLEQIEIMTNPPAKYDAAGNSGIVNIKTKKTKQLGYNISAQVGYTQGIYARNNQNINFNYRKNKVNLFGTLSRNERNTRQTLNIQRKFIEQNTKQVVSLFDQEGIMNNLRASHNAKLGADVYLSKKTTLGAVVNGFYNPGKFTNTSDIYISNPDNVLQSNTFARSTSYSLWQNFSSNVNFRTVFDSTGEELTADIDYIYYNAANTQDLSNYYFNAAGIPNEKPDTLYGNLPQIINIYSGKVDYVHPLKKGAKLEAGLKVAYVETDANAVYDSVINKQLVRDFGRSNHFVYDERIGAAYVNYSQPFSKKLIGQFGLRLENTVAHGNQLTTGEKFTLNYTQLFPTAYLVYKASEKHNWSVNYGRRINRPDYESLNPFVEFLDRYTFEQGNPNLRPQFSHNVELSHTYRGFLTTTLNYTKTNNIIQQVLEQNELTNQTFVKQANIANQRQYGAAVSAFAQVKNFSGNLYVNVYDNEFKGLVNNTFVTVGATTAVFNATASYKFKKGITAEVNGFYRTPGVEGVFKIGSLGAVNFGASVPILKNKATVRLNVRDIFWTQRVKGDSRFGNIDAAFQQAPDSRFVGINFTYRLSKGKVNGSKRRTGGASDEQNRVKGGDN
jgi:outer membrane receptor protein involved in Fe transport